MKFKILTLLLLVALVYGQDSNSEDDEYTYPCGTVDVIDCVRGYYENNTYCRGVGHQDGDPIENNEQWSYVPLANVTIISVGNIITIYGSQIESFRISKRTNELIMSVKFDSIEFHSTQANFHIKQQGSEPRIGSDFFNVTYSTVLTSVTSENRHLSLPFSTVRPYNTAANLLFKVGSQITNSSDEVVSRMYEALVENIPTTIQELLLTKAPYFYFIYFQRYICDFGYEYTGEVIHPI